MLAELTLTREALVRRWAELARDATTPDYYEINVVCPRGAARTSR